MVSQAGDRYQPVGKKHRVSISPEFVLRLKDQDAQSVGNQEDADNEARLEKENAHNVEIAWWDTVSAPFAPLFLPSQSGPCVIGWQFASALRGQRQTMACLSPEV